MKLYGSFLIRCWLTGDASPDERRVLQVEHIQTGASMRTASLTEAQEWMLETCRAGRSGVKTTRDEERGRVGER